MQVMRVTLGLHDDVLRAARALAAARDESLGAAVSDLARRGLRLSVPLNYRGALPVCDVSGGGRVFGPGEVARALDDE